ncbi:hemolysin III family protein [Kribbella pittospori]|uniref:Hemolysin III family protein n=2 Tax=Kribbella TaxID=182639 RepID=A0A4V2M799_9ACTN|nr:MULTISPECIES: hemolysin III family protein [Kribbella]TCC46762.1 hemolysin III family protein [Kribbella capetownensis]TCC60563.1 hemolysin III family protein [Kribbella pittospori]
MTATSAQPQEVGHRLSGRLAPLKPKLRGWLHAGTFPFATAAGIVLICLAPGAEARWAAAVYTMGAMLLFGISALYHRFYWGPTGEAILRRLDHSNIFLLIAGTYTPLGMVLLHGDNRLLMLGLVWGGALLGILFRIFWVSAPRWLYTPIYLALGWVAIFWMGDIYHQGGAAVVTLIAVGGGLYSIGAVIYGTKRPNPSPLWFGFHEIFHAFTVAAFICHYIAVSIATYQVG